MPCGPRAPQPLLIPGRAAHGWERGAVARQGSTRRSAVVAQAEMVVPDVGPTAFTSYGGQGRVPSARRGAVCRREPAPVPHGRGTSLLLPSGRGTYFSITAGSRTILQIPLSM